MSSRSGSLGLSHTIPQSDTDTAAVILILASKKIGCEFSTESLPLLRKLMTKEVLEYKNGKGSIHTVHLAGGRTPLGLTKKGIELAKNIAYSIDWWNLSEDKIFSN